MTIREKLSPRKTLANLLTAMRGRSTLSKRDLLLPLCLSTIVVIAILLRILPLAWGATLSEFDPFFQYEMTQHIVDNGFGSWLEWHTTREWYPTGRDIAGSSFPGLAFTGAAVYQLVRALGLNVSVMDVAIFFPVLAAAVTCVVIFFLGRDVGGSGVGLLAALFLAISPAYIGRTTLGFYDDETVGILGILLTFIFYLRALKGETKMSTSVAYSGLAGLSLGYVFASWGASRYLIALLALFTFFLLFTKVSGRRVIISYGILTVIGLAVAVAIPRLGFGFLKEFEAIAPLGVLLLFVLNEASLRFTHKIRRTTLLAMSFLGLAVGGLALMQLGVINLSPIKFMSVLNPFSRVDIAIVESVQEHRPATWASFYYQFGQLVFLAPLGIYFVFRRFSYEKLFIVIFALTMLYFSASMIRLTIVLAPALAILGSLAIVEIVKPFSSMIFQRSIVRRRQRLAPRLGRGFSALLVIAIFALSIMPIGRGIDSAYAPTTLAASSIPSRQQIGDWMQALMWMKENLPENAVVASWWDYGYWISIMAGKITLADNGTINGTSLANIGRMFMSNETDAIQILKLYDADYVVVFTTINQAQGGNYLFGDEVKWRWMAKIGWNNTADTPLEDTEVTSYLANAWSQQTQDTTLTQWYDQFKTYALPKSDRVLTKLMINGAFPGLDQVISDLTLQHFQLAYASDQRFVLVYKVVYPS
ncbi:glycosyltransferase family 39 protein [Candidatus Bathyarchaeota archaeon]|nr:glycosyltransferase family 39 protein [Candidatus Bathyarchaeota archaeon]